MDAKRDIQPGAKAVSFMRARLSLGEVFYNFCIATANYRTVFLQSLGVSAGRIGVLTSVFSIANIIAPPIWGAISDKMRSARRCFIICLALSAVCMALVYACTSALTNPYWGVITCLCISCLFTVPANNMMEIWLAQIDNLKIGISYGSIRMWASLGFAFMGVMCALILKALPVSYMFLLYFVFAIPAILLALSVPEMGAERVKQRRVRFRDMRFESILNYYIVAFMAFSAIHTVALNWKHTYFIYLLNDYGYEGAAFGLFMGVTAVCEVPGLLVSRKIIARLGVIKPLFACLFATMLETLLYALGASIYYVVVGQILKGLAMGLQLACQIQYIYRRAPKGLETTAQAMIGATGALVAIISSAFGGYALQALGVRQFYLVLAGIELLSIAVFAGFIVRGKRAFDN